MFINTLKLLPLFIMLILVYFIWLIFGNHGVCRTIPLVSHLGSMTYDLGPSIIEDNVSNLNTKWGGR